MGGTVLPQMLAMRCWEMVDGLIKSSSHILACSLIKLRAGRTCLHVRHSTGAHSFVTLQAACSELQQVVLLEALEANGH